MNAQVIQFPDLTTVNGILDTYCTNKYRSDGYLEGEWHDHATLCFKVGPAKAEIHSPHNGFSGLYSVRVKEKKRGRGHGRRLMEVITAFADANGRGLWLNVEADNEVAIHLYESFGFRITWTRTPEDADRFGIANRATTHGMQRYPARISAASPYLAAQWVKHFEEKVKTLEQDHEPTPEGTDDIIPMLDAIYAAQMKRPKTEVDERDRYSSSKNYRDNTRRLHGLAFKEALEAQGWTITRTVQGLAAKQGEAGL